MTIHDGYGKRTTVEFLNIETLDNFAKNILKLE